jgi:1-acyl-sn-glycerol-3-phosphate acyltransferase
MRLMRWAKASFFLLAVRPFVALILGKNIRHGQRLPQKGPLLIVANHNSHLDTVLLMSLFPARVLSKVRPVAAADYFSRSRWLSTFVNVAIQPLWIPRWSKASIDKLLAPVVAALDRGEIVIFFPEGTRGKAEQMQDFKPGIAVLAQQRPDIPIVPIYMTGLGKALPKGDWLFVPYFCDVVVGEPQTYSGDPTHFRHHLQHYMTTLAAELPCLGMRPRNV